MIKIFFALLFVSFSSAAFADDGSCTADTACDVSRIQDNRSDYRGILAATTQDMVCVHAVAYERTSLVLVDGDQQPGSPVHGDVLTSWRVQESAWKPWAQDSDRWVREICFPRAMLRDGNDPSAPFRDALTLCNGEYLDQPLRHRSVWRSSKGVPEFIHVERRVEADNAACLLGSAECALHGL